MGGVFYKKRYVPPTGRNRPVRPKTFTSEEAAKKWAEAQKLKNYSLVNLRSTESTRKKIKVVVQ